MKRLFAVLCITSVMLCGCGSYVSEEEYKSVVAEKDAIYEKYNTLLADYAKLENKLNSENATETESAENENKELDMSETDVINEEETSQIDDVSDVSEEEYKESCQEYNYKDVLRNPEEYVGKKVKITVRISSVHEDSWLNDEKYYFAYSNDKYDMWLGDSYAIYDRREVQNPKLLSEDIITVWGEISSPEQTTSLILNSEEIFVIDMKYVELISE